MPSNALGRGLGWFSIALGAAEIAIPNLLARGIGIKPDGKTSLVMRLMGLREIAAGVNVLLQPRRPLPLWTRVAGDALDLALLGLATTKRTSGLRLAGAIAAVGGVTALDVLASVQTQKHYDATNKPVLFSVTINKTPQEVYAAYRDFSRLPEFMDFLESVEVHDAKRSTWTAKLPLGQHVSWDADITEDVPGEVIAWRSVDGSKIKTEGRVTFAKAPGRNITEVRVELKLGFTGFGLSNALAKYFAKPQVKGDLRRFKQVVETGEVLKSDATVTLKPHPAQPSTPAEIKAGATHADPVFIPNPPTAEKGLTGEKGTGR